MRSHLTRAVFRRILANQPLIFHRAVHHSVRVRPHLRSHCPVVHRPDRRTFMGLFQSKKARDVREPLLDPGMAKMLDLEKRVHLVARHPPPVELAQAYKAFIKAKRDRRLPIEDFHAARLLQTLESIRAGTLPGEKMALQPEEVFGVLEAMKEQQQERYSSVHADLARLAYTMFIEQKTEEYFSHGWVGKRRRDLSKLNRVLCRSGNTSEALQNAQKFTASIKSTHRLDVTLGRQVIKGFADEGNEADMLNAFALLDQKEDSEIFPATCWIIATFYAQRDDVPKTKSWINKGGKGMDTFDDDADSVSLITKKFASKPYYYRILLEFCLRNNEMEWGQQVLQAAVDAPQTWRAILQASAATGKSVEELDEMLKAIVERTGGEDIDILVINGLLEYAIMREDAYLAERYFNLAQRHGSKPNAQTYVTQIRYRLIAKDHTGALAAYKELRAQPVQADEDWEVMNELIRAMTRSPKPDHETIMGLIADLSDRKRLFPAETVASLCRYHLSRDEFFELVDLLQTYAYQYCISDRIMLRDVLIAVCKDPKSDTARIWDTYMVVHQVFDVETAREIRQSIMAILFERGRPDLATHVFVRMSSHARADTRPDLSTYVAAFKGIAETAEPEALEVIHNILKLDTEVEPNTQLLNGLILAYTSCDRPERAIEFWAQIAMSDEGPDYNSLAAAFRAAQYSEDGHMIARGIWSRLEESDIAISRNMLASYVAALSGNRLWEECGKIIVRMPELTGQDVDAFVIGAFYNGCRAAHGQEQIKVWAETNYPELWKELEAKGMKEDKSGQLKIADIDPPLTP